ncbi:MAG TPA: ABC transporter permease [Longimicrobiales bacterium]|nr:ABC transporter permease [Longimicrobiales bacterium]
MSGAFSRLVLLVARRDYLRTVRRRGFVAGTLLLPASVVLVFAVSSLVSFDPTGGAAGPVLVVNESGVPLQVDPRLAPDVLLVSRDEAESRLADGSVAEFFVVPGAWSSQPNVRLVVGPEAGRSGPIEVVTRRQVAQAQVELLLRSSLLRAAGLPDSALGELLTPITFTSVTPDGEVVSDASVTAGFIVPYVFTLIFVLSIFITSGYLLQSVTEEKENRVVEIVLSSVPALPLMAGKVLGLGAAGLTQVAIWMTTAIVAIPLANQQFSIDVSVSPVTLALAMLFFCLGYLSYGAIFAAVGALAPGAREAQQYSSFFGFFAVIPLVFTPLFLTEPNSPIVWALALLPLTAPAAVLELLAVPGSSPLLVLASLISQLAFMAIAIFAAGRIFRATLLLYGTQPSVRRIVGALTGRA